MKSFYRVQLAFFAAVLQVVIVEGRLGDGRGEGAERGGDGRVGDDRVGQGGGSTGGGRGATAGIVVGTIASVVFLTTMALRHRRRVMSLFGRRSIPQDGQLDANKTSKDLDLEKGSPLKGAPTSSTSVGYGQVDWRRNLITIPPQIHPGPAPPPYLKTVGASQNSQTQPSPTPHLPPMPQPSAQPPPEYGQ